LTGFPDQPDWRILSGQQLSFDLTVVEASPPPPDPVLMFERKKQATDLLRELALSLGELRAAAEIESFRKSLVWAEEEPPS
jgi:hypothetical protein